MHRRTLSRTTRRYWKLLLVIAMLMQLFLMLKDSLWYYSPKNDPAPLQTDAKLPTIANEAFSCPENPNESSCKNFLYVQSGYQNKDLPAFCSNSGEIFGRATLSIANDKAESQRGVHMAVLTASDLSRIYNKVHFDTYINDAEFVNMLIYGIRQGDVILLASFDEMTVALSDTARAILVMYYGAREIETLSMRDHYVMIGQKGLAKGYAHETIVRRRTNQDYPNDVARLSLCLNLPLGPLSEMPPESVVRSISRNSNRGLMTNCGLDHTCDPSYSVPVWISTGFQDQMGPELCVNSHLIFHPLLKYGGSGLNLAQYDPSSQQVITQDRFDLLWEEPTRLRIFLEKIPEDQLLFGVIHNDASRIQENMTVFGITVTQMLQHRSVGFFVGQKGAAKAIQSLSHGANFDTNTQQAEFPPTVTFRGCIPRQIRGIAFSWAPIAESKIEHRFCGVNGIALDSYCFQEKSNPQIWVDPPSTEPIQVWSIPVAIVAGNDVVSLSRTLESLKDQYPVKIDRSLVTVFCAVLSVDFNDTISLVKIHSLKYDICSADVCSNLDQLYQYAFKRTIELSSAGKSQFIFIDKDVTLAPSFVTWIKKLNSDQLTGVSGFNHNSFVGRALDPTVAFLTDQALPSPCFLVNTGFAREVLLLKIGQYSFRDKMKPWKLQQTAIFAIPEISRCFQMPSTTPPAKKRTFLGVDSDLIPFGHLQSAEKYKQHLIDVIKKAGKILNLQDSNLIGICQSDNGGEEYASAKRFPIVLQTSELNQIADGCKLYALKSHFGMFENSFWVISQRYEFLVVHPSSRLLERNDDTKTFNMSSLQNNSDQPFEQ